jgi:hypothetical protein
MDWKWIVLTGALLALLAIAVPWLVFWAVGTLFGYRIEWSIWSIGAFWVLFFVARGSLSFRKVKTY